MKSLGFKVFADHLRGDLSLQAAILRAGGETRRYAKRQITWFRHQTPDWPRITAPEPDEQWAQLRALNHALTIAL